VTLAAKFRLSLCFLIFLMMVALAAHEDHIDGDDRVMVGGAYGAFLALVVAIGIFIFDVVFRWTRSALRELLEPER
jgi:Kef-type K+ transport system membrane component KefB